MFEVPNSNITEVHVDEGAVLGEIPVQYKYSQQEVHTGSGPDEIKNGDADARNLSRTGDSVAA